MFIKKEKYNCEQEEVYGERILHLIFQHDEEDKKLYQNKILLKKCKEDEILSLEEHLSFKKILLLYGWIRRGGIRMLRPSNRNIIFTGVLSVD